MGKTHLYNILQTKLGLSIEDITKLDDKNLFNIGKLLINKN